MTRPLALDGRVAYVTGSTRGIGNAIARTLAAQGAAVVVNGRTSETTVAAMAEELRVEHGTACTGIFADQRDPAAISGAYRHIFATYGRLDVLVNNAGILDDALLGMIQESTILETFETNTLAVLRNMQAAARLMRRTGGGSIINIASIIGVMGNPGEAVYGGSKAAVIGMTKSAAKELAPIGIRVNAIAPGFIDTDMTRAMVPARFDERLASVGMGRIGKPDDVANVALFLASDLSTYVTGQVIGVDGIHGDMTFPGLGRWDRPAVVSAVTGEVLRYRDLEARGGEVCAPMGRAKELLLLLCRNDAFTVAAYSGAMAAGHAVALLDARSAPELLADLVMTYRPAWMAGDLGMAERLSACGVPVRAVMPVHGGELVRTGHPSPTGLHPDLSVLLATSGTTGSRRFVRLSEQNIRANAKAIAGYLELTPDELPITSLPLHYTFGLSVLNSHLFAGAAVVVTEDTVIQKPFWETFRTHGCTSLAGVPFTYQMLERVGFREMDLPTLATLQQAGGALDLPLTRTYAEYMARRGGRFFVMYGQTEATARMAYVPPERLLEKLGSAGIAIPGGRLRIEAGASRSPEGRIIGEVVYEGPNVMMGYSSGPDDLERSDDLHGELRTGDIGYLDGDGFLFLVGRSKRIAKVFGLRVNLDEVELVLRENGPAAVVGAPDAIWAFCAFGTDESIADLAKSLARRYRLHPSALHFRHVEAVPTLESGKIDYRKVQAWMTS